MARRSRSVSRQVVPVDTGQAMTRISGGWLLVHGLPLAAPLIVCGVFALLIGLAHGAWGGDPVWTPLIAIVFLLIGVAMTMFGWVSAGPRQLLRVLVTTSGVLATVNLVLGLVIGMGLIWPAYLVCSLVVTVLWAIWRGTKYAGSTGAGADPAGGNPLLEAIRQARVRFEQPKVDERGVVRAKVVTEPGGTLEGARALLPHLSAEARAVPGGTNLAGDPAADGIGVLEIATRDNLAVRGGLTWPGPRPEEYGAPPTVPLAVGEYQTEPCMVALVGDADADPGAPDIVHVKIGGVTGAGKSVCARCMLGALSVRSRLNTVGIDVSKGLQTFGPVAHGMDWVITDMTQARRFMKRIRQVIAGRADHLAREGLMRWSLRSSLNLLLIWIEESSDFMALATDYEHLVAKARSAGIMVISSVQRATYRSMPTDARANHGAGICFGVDDAEDAEYVLPKPALAALGKHLPTWGVSRPGYAYLAGLGVPQATWSRMMRVYHPADEDLIEVATAGQRFRTPMDQVTAGLFGELYHQRTCYTRPVWGTAAATAPAAAPAATPGLAAPATGPAYPPPPAHRPPAGHTTTADPAGHPDDEETKIMNDASAEAAQDALAMRETLAGSRRYHLGEHATPADFDDDVDPETPIAPLDDADNGGDEPDEQDERLTTEQARAVFDQALDAWYREGRPIVRTSDLAELLVQAGRSRRFLYHQVERWIDAGHLAARDEADGWDLIGSPLEDVPQPA